MKTVKLLVLVAVLVIIVRFVKSLLGWHSPELFASNIDRFDFDVEWNRVLPAIILWIAFSVYWSIASRNSAPTQKSESTVSTVFHQLLLNVALILLIWPAPGLSGWFLPMRFHFLVAVGASIQAACIVLAV